MVQTLSYERLYYFVFIAYNYRVLNLNFLGKAFVQFMADCQILVRLNQSEINRTAGQSLYCEIIKKAKSIKRKDKAKIIRTFNINKYDTTGFSIMTPWFTFLNCFIIIFKNYLVSGKLGASSHTY